MDASPTPVDPNRPDPTLIRAGGVAMLLAIGIHIYANMFLKEFPPVGASIGELSIYFEQEHRSWAIVHGLRNVAILAFAVFIAALYAKTRGRAGSATGWNTVGLIGGTLLLASLLVANGIETFAFLDFELLSEQPSLFWAMFYASRVLFTAEVATWAVFLLGFNIAAWRTNSLPKLIVGLGVLSGFASLVSGIFVVPAWTGGWAAVTLEIATLSGIAWFFLVSVLMIVSRPS